MDRSFLNWPFFEQEHRDWAMNVEAAVQGLKVDHTNVDMACRTLVTQLGDMDLLRVTASYEGRLDVRKLCLAREILARHDGLADFAFAMQGLGTGAISLFGTEEQKKTWLPQTSTGKAIAAFALTEPQSGSDVANSKMTAHADGDTYVLNGEKTWISNGGIADMYTLFARTGEAPGAKGLSTFIVTPELAGFEVVERLATIAPHPLARIRFTDCRHPVKGLKWPCPYSMYFDLRLQQQHSGLPVVRSMNRLNMCRQDKSQVNHFLSGKWSRGTSQTWRSISMQRHY